MEWEDDEKDDKKDEGVYNWERKFERTWDSLIDDDGGLRSLASERKRRKRNAQKETRNIRKGMSRHMYLVVDLSKAMAETDMKPFRLTLTLNTVESFIMDYFDQNPLSQMGIIISRGSIAEKITELSGNPSKHINALKAASATIEGEVSLQNSLEVAYSSLCFIPKYGSREVVIIFGSLTTCDPGDIHETIEKVKKENIKCSVIGLAAEVYICKAIADKTGGACHVALNETHFKELLFNFSPPPPANSKMETTLIRMGFSSAKTREYSYLVCLSSTSQVWRILLSSMS